MYKDWKYFFMTEVKNWSSRLAQDLLILDWVAMLKSRVKQKMIGYEIKVSRSDFLNDQKRQYYLQYVHEFYFACPEGLIKKDELPEHVWLVYVNNWKVNVIKRATYREVWRNSDMLRYIIMSKLEEQKSDKREYRTHINDYIADKLSGKLLWQMLKTKMAKELTELHYELNSIKGDKEKLEKIVLAIEEKVKQLNHDKVISIRSSLTWCRTEPSSYIEVLDQLVALRSWMPEHKLQSIKNILKRIDDLQNMSKNVEVIINSI